MEVLICNDGKEKYQSFEATIMEDDVFIQAFGKDLEESVTELKKNVHKMIVALQEIDYSKVSYVDAFGRKINTR